MSPEQEQVAREKLCATLYPENISPKYVHYSGMKSHINGVVILVRTVAQSRDSIFFFRKFKVSISLAHVIKTGSTPWRRWLRHYATSQKATGSIPDGVIIIFH